MISDAILPERSYLRMRLLAVHCSRKAPQASLWRMAFHLTLFNTSRLGLRLLGRKWVIHDTENKTHILEAEHLFGQDPMLSPGAVFAYSGYHDCPYCPTTIELRIFGIDQLLVPFISTPCVFPNSVFPYTSLPTL
ncbi:MAG: ApaG domain [Akkermansiaceae bacterium]|nr:ApaG domain [Akkermansiaceae bacterium]